MRPFPSAVRRRTAMFAAAVALAACSADADPSPDADVSTDVEADVSTDVDAAPDPGAATGQVPPLLEAIDAWPETTVTVEADDPVQVAAKVATEPAQRQQGLMHVPELPDGVGMLFLFDAPSSGGFWMKDTLVPLDIAYIADGEVVDVMTMEPCGDQDPCPSYTPGTAYDAALEVAQGTLTDAGVEAGTVVRWTEPQEVDR